jgi:hypothetical protein
MSQAHNIGWVETNADLTEHFNNLVSNNIVGQSNEVIWGLQYKPAHSDKASISIEDLCARMGLIDLAEHKVDIIVVMDPSQGAYIEAVDLAAANKIIQASTANVPPLNQSERTICDDFWQNQFASHDSISINNRHNSAPIQKVADDIIKMAIK